MKKALLKVFGVAALAAGMMFNVQVFDTGSISDISLAALGNVANAQNEGDDDDDGWLWQEKGTNSSCTMQRTVTVWICGGAVYYTAQGYGCRTETRTENVSGTWTTCVDGWDLFCSSGCA